MPVRFQHAVAAVVVAPMLGLPGWAKDPAAAREAGLPVAPADACKQAVR